MIIIITMNIIITIIMIITAINAYKPETHK